MRRVVNDGVAGRVDSDGLVLDDAAVVLQLGLPHGAAAEGRGGEAADDKQEGAHGARLVSAKRPVEIEREGSPADEEREEAAGTGNERE